MFCMASSIAVDVQRRLITVGSCDDGFRFPVGLLFFHFFLLILHENAGPPVLKVGALRLIGNGRAEDHELRVQHACYPRRRTLTRRRIRCVARNLSIIQCGHEQHVVVALREARVDLRHEVA